MPQKWKNFPKICQFLPNFVKKWPKYRQNIEKYRQVVQKLPFFGCIGVVLVLQEIFLYRIGLGSIFCPKKWVSNWYWYGFLEIFFYCIGLEMDFLAKNFGYWYWVDLTKIQNAALCSAPILDWHKKIFLKIFQLAPKFLIFNSGVNNPLPPAPT